MSGLSRRKFLKQGSLGAAAVGAALTPGLLSSGLVADAPASSARGAGAALPQGPLSVYVKDHTSGTVVVMVGEHEVEYRDADLTARLARIASQVQPA